MPFQQITRRSFGLCLMAGVALPLPLMAKSSARRVVVLGGSVAEIIADLGAADELVGRDTTSTYPASIMSLPDVGYLRALPAEGVLSLTPDLILAEQDAGPPPVIEVLKAAGITYVTIPGDPTPEGVIAKITATADALDRQKEGAALAEKVRGELQTARDKAAAIPEDRRRSVVFVLSMQGGAIVAGGEGSSAEGIITLAGAHNAAKGFKGYKPMTDEAILAAAPDAILVMDREGQQAITPDMILAHPTLGQTPAAKEGHIIAMDGMLLLGFGPRTGQAALTLNHRLYGEGE